MAADINKLDFWVFGGYGEFENLSPGRKNGLWKFRTDINQWTWMKGDKTMNPLGIYGEQGVPKGYNVPGSRERGMMWSDAQGNLWLFGGIGYDSNNAFGVFNDVWRFTPKVPSRVEFDEAVLY
jgi:N-acetylneuraminic acid mutarotase